MPFFIISLILQVAIVLHIVKTGRSTTWIWIVMMLPLAGAIVYLIVEVLPGIFGSRAGRSASKKVSDAIDPNQELNQAANEYSKVDSIKNSIHLADELIAKEMYADAKILYEKCLNGIHKTDPDIMHGLAVAEFNLSNYKTTKELLEHLKEHNPDFNNQDAHLLYARTLEALNFIGEAIHEYEVLHEYFSGPEASYFYGLLCKKLGQVDLANKIFQEISMKALQSGTHYQSLYKVWLGKAEKELNN